MNEQKRQNILPSTNEDTTGPYFPINFRDRSLEDLTLVEEGVIATAKGNPIILRGKISDRFGNLATGVLMEFWQANAAGVYRTPKTESHPDVDPWFNGFGRLRSHDGNYTFKTIMPGAVDARAPNITITLFSDGISRVVTQAFFANQPANAQDPLLQVLNEDDQRRLTATHEGRDTDGCDVYEFNIVMAGEDETPFFDDFES